MLLTVITSNCVQKSTVDNEHSHHYTHDSLFHFHEHVHSQSTHSHYHSTNTITMLDYFCISDKDNNIYFLKLFYEYIMSISEVQKVLVLNHLNKELII